ncbi:hypothetical protein [Massilia sp. YIM B02443]|uniref:hypothetical protein n=1 Tax=Massilia sp. YIM B02443 TaxID=3050127 RepID=UPI0025B705F5|nr:hypothetical protein [Massilia sp. YIM B02443]MDN4036675.1 hypothetical protein [Massilia sp. YIM B02443]
MKPIDLLRASLHRRRSRYRSQLGDMAPELRAAWFRHAPLEFPGIPLSDLFFIRAAEGLMNFFEIAQTAHTSYALPSLAADSVWHAWLRWDEDDLARFCRRHFQAPVAHLPQEALDALALPRTLVACRHSDGIPAHAARLPRLFELDSRLRMPLGHAYRQRGFNIDYARLNAEGRYRYDGATHPALSLRALLAAGFISQMMYEQALGRHLGAGHGHAMLVDGGADLDGGGADSDGGSGGGDGGGCGGGCGGGGGD